MIKQAEGWKYTGLGMKIHKLVLVVMLGSGLSGPVYSCDQPLVPDLPDPSKAVLAEMVKAQNEVKQYLKLADDFLKCTKDDAQHDLVVDRMRDIGTKFNDVVKAYKARVANK